MRKSDLKILYINVSVRVRSDDIRKKKKDKTFLKLKLTGVHCNPQPECYDDRLSYKASQSYFDRPQKAGMPGPVHCTKHFPIFPICFCFSNIYISPRRDIDPHGITVLSAVLCSGYQCCGVILFSDRIIKICMCFGFGSA